jgi:ABC-type sugar transport system ATPase subunit
MPEGDRQTVAARGSELAISLRGVVKRFGPIVAVDGLDLEVRRGVCFGLL